MNLMKMQPAELGLLLAMVQRLKSLKISLRSRGGCRVHRCLDLDGPRNRISLTSQGLCWLEVNDAMMARAKPDALFMHCLPAHRGEEVAASVIDGPQSVVYDQAETVCMRRRLSWYFWRECAFGFLAQGLCRIATIAVFFLC